MRVAPGLVCLGLFFVACTTEVTLGQRGTNDGGLADAPVFVLDALDNPDVPGVDDCEFWEANCGCPPEFPSCGCDDGLHYCPYYDDCQPEECEECCYPPCDPSDPNCDPNTICPPWHPDCDCGPDNPNCDPSIDCPPWEPNCYCPPEEPDCNCPPEEPNCNCPPGNPDCNGTFCFSDHVYCFPLGYCTPADCADCCCDPADPNCQA